MSARDPHNKTSTSTPAMSADELLTVDEAAERYRDQWVLMKVVERDERHQPARGFVLAHSFDEQEVNAALAKEPPLGALPPEERTHSYYVFNAYPHVSSGPAYEAAVRQFVIDFVTEKAKYDARRRR
jgi:hypothetical protein